MTEPAALPGLPSLAKYELLEEIGHGGMATVYRARDKRLGREVAIKVIHKHLRENAEVGTRFVAEARAAAKLRHPGIVEVYDVSSEEDGERYLVVELLRGTTLRKILLAHREMPAEIGASIVLSLCEALEHAHASGIVHRDVKPENVLVELPTDRERAPREREGVANDVAEPSEPRSSPRPVASRSAEACEEGKPARRAARPGDLGVVVKLTDFGIAKILDAQGVTSTGQVLGSPAHMAPEQIEAGEVDGRTDVFALGVLMYECLVGHLPFEGKNPAQVLRRVLEGSYAPADRERGTVGGRWAKIIDGALARLPADRTESPGKLGEQIRAELEALGITDFRAEIAAYFDAPSAYAEALVAKLVPRLVARGEAARKAGDVPGAEADFNRALALAPNDLAILKRVTSMTSTAARKVLVKRAAVVAGAAVCLGALAFGVARLRKDTSVPSGSTDAEARDGETPSIARPNDKPLTDAATGDPAAPPSAVAASSSAEPSKSIRIKLPMLPASAITPPVVDRPSDRKVMFTINPPGATLLLDGKEETWFSRVFTLKTGNHATSVIVRESKCCEVYSGAVVVEPPPDGEPNAVQRIPIRLKLLPATVVLSSGPSGGQLVCPGLQLTVPAGGSRKVALNEVSKAEKCQIVAPSEEPIAKNLNLRAGENHVVDWPRR